jgi:hypothetical protein
MYVDVPEDYTEVFLDTIISETLYNNGFEVIDILEHEKSDLFD